MKYVWEILPWIIAVVAVINCFQAIREKNRWKSNYYRISEQLNDYLDKAEIYHRQLKSESYWLVLCLPVFAIWGAVVWQLWLKFKNRK